MLHRRNNDAAVPCEREEGLLGNWQATNSLIIVNGQPFGIGGKKGKLLLARSLGVKKALFSDDPFPLPDRSFTTHARAVQADRPGRAALASVTPPPEPGQPRQRRLADRHPSRDLRQKLRKYGIERPWPSRSHAIHAVVESLGRYPL